MFGWIKKLWKGTGEDFYHPKERLIYSFFDGEKNRSVDPQQIYSKILAKRAVISADFGTMMLEVENPFTEKAERNFYKTVREIFDLPSTGPGHTITYEEDGKTVKTLSDPECWELFDHFLLFVERLKKNSKPSLISSTQVQSQSSQECQQPIPNGSVDGSTKTDPLKEEQAQ